MFFQFSPVKKAPPKKPIEQKNESEEVAVLSLAPFSAKPKLFFEDVKCGVTSSRKLLIKNPTHQDVNVNLKKNFPEELVVTFNWEECLIEKLSEALLEIKWCPNFEFASRLMITIEDGKKIKVDIPVVFKSISPKKKTGTKPKQFLASKKAKSPMKKVISTKVKSPQKKSSPRCRPPLMMSNSQTKTPPQMQRSIPGIVITTSPNRRETFCIKGKENRYISPNKAPYLLAHKDDTRRQTYTLNNIIIKPPKSPEIFNDSLESISPDPPVYKVGNRRILSPLVENNYTTNFSYKLDYMSFKFSPTKTPNKSNITMSNSVSNFADKINRLDLCSSENITFDFQSPNSTRIEDKIQNLMFSPSESIIAKLNSSTSTCVKGHTSFETYVKGNVSGGTYVKDTSVGDVAALSESINDHNNTNNAHYDSHNIHQSLSFSNKSRLQSLHGEGCKSVIGANMWSEKKSNSVKSYEDLQERKKQNTTLHDFKLPQNPHRLSLKRKIDTYAFSPPKKALLERQPRMSLNWSKSSGAALRISKSVSALNLNKTNNGKQLTSKETKTCIINNPFLLAATNKIDPFMTSQVYSDEDWIAKQINHFMKWLNALLTPPAEFETKSDVKIDVAKVWQDIKNRDVAVVPTKEYLSNKYHTSVKLTSLRKNAQILYRSLEIATVLSKLVISIDGGKLNIRTDKEFYLDLNIKSELMSLLLSYNALWLRIGLETVYNEEIPLHSNSDITGLSSFLAERFFKEPKLVKKYKSLIDPKYKEPFKKIFLKRFLSLIYFLDQAKNKKIIAHDPCLFRKNAPVKESREILIRFAKETLSGVGDITKFLKYFGYFVTHKQTFINEFDYAVTNLGVDLRDGVRLTKVMEIILLKNGLTSLLRVPAISRLQKIHNVKIVFDSLEAEGFKILYDIEPKDIVDGHKEKSLSFLWQIIYKFEAPLMVKSSTTIQKWYRSLPVVLKRRKLDRIRQSKIEAATKIQKWYKRQILSEKLFFFAVMLHYHLDSLRKQNAATKIQACFRMHLCRKDFLCKISIIINIQRYAKGWLIRNIRRHGIVAAVKLQSFTRSFLQRRKFLRLKHATRVIQIQYRAMKKMREQRNYYHALKKSAIVVQTRFRANIIAKKEREQYVKLKNASVELQRKYRALVRMRIDKNNYEKLKKAAIVLQTRYKANQLCISQRKSYNDLKNKTIYIQRLYRANKLMTKIRNEFITLRKASIQIQTWYRSIQIMRQHKERYQTIKKAATVLQCLYRAKQLCISHRTLYIRLKDRTIFIQRLYRANKLMAKCRSEFITLRNASIKIQTWYRSILIMRQCKEVYLTLKKAVKTVEERYIAKKKMETEQEIFRTTIKAVVTIQQKLRATLQMRICKKHYFDLKNAAKTVQTRLRADKLAKIQRNRYLELKKATKLLQQRYRANCLMKFHRREYLLQKTAIVKIQTWYRSIQAMRQCKQKFQTLKKAVRIVEERYIAKKRMETQQEIFRKTIKAVVTIQQKLRATMQMRICKKQYLQMKNAAITLQTRFQANKSAKIQRNSYLELKKATVLLQSRYRANCLMNMQRRKYLLQKTAIIKIQIWYKSILIMRKQRDYYRKLKHSVKIVEETYLAKKSMIKAKNEYSALKKTTVLIQQIFRANIAMKKALSEYKAIQKATIKIQQKFKARQIMILEKNRYETLKKATIIIQTRYRAQLLMRYKRQKYDTLKKSVVFVQSRFNANKAMSIQRNNYLKLKDAILVFQRKYRAKKAMQVQKKNYENIRKSIIFVQRKYRANKVAKMQRYNYLVLRKSAIVIQTYFRAKKAMENERNSYMLLKQNVTNVQIRYRAILKMRIDRESYVTLRKSCVIIQQQFRAKVAMTLAINEYQKTRNAAVAVQRQFRAQIAMKVARSDFVLLKNSCILVQRRLRAQKLMIKERTAYLELRKYVNVVQQRFRANRLMKEELRRYQNVRKAVLHLQNKFRATILMRKERNRFYRVREAILIIQNFYYGYKKMQCERKIFIEKRLASIQLQKCVRGFLVRKKYAKYLTPEAKEERRLIRVQNAAASKIQATWKGYRQRSIEIDPEMAKIRKRVENANKNATPRNTLAQRCDQAVDILILDHTSLLQIIRALEDIDFITRRCKDTCLKMSKILPDQLYLMISYTARSLPEMTACTLACSILINFYKYEPTTEKSFVGDYMDNMVTVMLNWCDKEAPLFPAICTLLWLFSHKPEYKAVILKVPHLQQRLLKVQTLTYRKEKMVGKTGVKGSSLFAHQGNLPLPSTTPDWGLEYKHKPNVFKNSVHALKSLLSILDMRANS
ncbi:unnamed protein product [Brassicogethes aeneus]|uniref:Calponin-homology (CH) domain-containing protein n=1 Tax=Brassicogethes aeneus TaxID=1431903 RepID=A0A9P0B103_BRAAE|nr:unnamed protein product [Brassicogethes aeneus]